jgi:hypothetical protein
LWFVATVRHWLRATDTCSQKHKEKNNIRRSKVCVAAVQVEQVDPVHGASNAANNPS